ncbi:MAG TPA: hypothetical protein VH413_12655 [Verrucomicrobiae bacterium]|jgi:hypothetical protein|nr:hypothetical protein [Verrucomicrobiae bacterium]
MQVGQKVVCVDDSFPGPLAKYYASLPVKGRTYTIRAVFLGRGIMHTKPGASDGEVGVLLKELQNGPDPRNKYGQELGFNSQRFRPLDELESTEAQEQEEEFVLVHDH